MAFPQPRSGTWLVAGMIGFGLLLTVGLYAYLTLQTAPFRDLTAAIAARYPDSSPRVDGGKPRLDRPGPSVLRIVMKSPIDLDDESAADSFARDVANFAAGNRHLDSFGVIEIHLFRENPERALSQRTVRLDVGEINRQFARSHRP